MREEVASLKEQIEDLQSKAPGRDQKNKIHDLKKELQNIIHTTNELKSLLKSQNTSRGGEPLAAKAKALSREEWDSQRTLLNEEMNVLGKEIFGKRSENAYKLFNEKFRDIRKKLDTLASQALDKTQKMNAEDLLEKLNDIHAALKIRY